MEEKKYSEDYTLTELMIVASAREVRDGDVVFIGTGLPFLACALAKKTHAPNLIPCSEQGQTDANPLLWRTPRAIGDLALTAGAKMTTDLISVMHRLTYGEFDLGFLSGAQVDKYGNVNSTCIGDVQETEGSLPGIGGANAIATFAKPAHADFRPQKTSVCSTRWTISPPPGIRPDRAQERKRAARQGQDRRLLSPRSVSFGSTMTPKRCTWTLSIQT